MRIHQRRRRGNTPARSEFVTGRLDVIGQNEHSTGTMHSQENFSRSVPSVLTLMMMVFFAVSPRFLLSPLLLRIATTFGVGYGRASAVFLTASFGFVTGLLTSGYIAHRLTHRFTIVFAIGLSGILLIALSMVRSFAAFHVVLFFCGWATGLYPGSGVTSVAAAVADRHRGKAMAIHESGPNIAFILAPVLSAAIAPTFGWHGVFVVFGVAAIVAAIVFLISGRGLAEPGQPPNFSNLRMFIHDRSFWVIVLLLAIAAVGAIGVYSVLPTFLIAEHGYSERFVNSYIGVSRVTGFVAILTAGVLADRIGFSAVIAVIIGVTGVMTILLGLTTGAPLLIAVFLQPMLVQSFFPVAINGLTLVVPPAARSLAVSLAIPLANLVGTGIAPRALGAAGSAGVFGLGFVIAGVLTVASLALLPLLRGGPLARRTEA
ncbi:MAG: MFS transporter [Spirochaetaceae bacterium]|nr:MAG: MFS transporter [Spirochaetaceae bacterium]